MKVAVASDGEAIEQLDADTPRTDASQSEPSLSSYVPVKVITSPAVSKATAEIVG